MKCSFCGKKLEEGAEFCPECGMILSLGGVTNEPDESKIEAEVPEYVPNVFRAMDFEEEAAEPARELEVSDAEETAVVVEAIAEYTDEIPADQEVAVVEVTDEQETSAMNITAEVIDEEIAEEAVEEEPVEVPQDDFTVPEYDPTAEVTGEYLNQSENIEEAAVEAAEAIEEDSTETVDESAGEDTEFTPPEYEGGNYEDISSYSSPQTAYASQQEAEVAEEPAAEETATQAEEQIDTYPVYNIEDNEVVPEEKPLEDASVLVAIIEDADSEKIEDITPAVKKAKTSKNNYATVVLLIVVLIGVVFAGGYVFKNVLPQVMGGENTTTTASEQTTTKAPEKTTEPAPTEKPSETTTKPTTTKPTTTKPTTTKPTTTKPTTTEPPETTAVNAEPVVVEPSDYNVDEVPFFPVEGDIGIKAGPSATSGDMITHPFGYPVYAYAKQGNYYYVHSPYLDYMGWVYAKDIVEYVEEGQTATQDPDVEESTTKADTQVEDTTATPSEDDDSYIAMINSDVGLKFRTGPGEEYGSDIVVPGGFYVRVTSYSEENPGWVYVTVEDDRYPYGAPSGWVLEDYLI